MKIEIEVPDELLKKAGAEAVQSYLTRKAEQFYQLMQNQSGGETNLESTDSAAIDAAWQNFNKRGMSC